MTTTLPERLRRAVSDPGNRASASGMARAKRWTELLARFPALADMRVLDLGGRPEWWARDPHPAALTTVNLESAKDLQPWMQHVIADACEPGQEFHGERFDLVVSNSLLEHVGGYYRRRQLADAIHAAADRHWVQTPNRYFPIEPHWLAPGWQFLPIPVRARILHHWPLQHTRPKSRSDALDCVLATELVTRDELRLLFPESELWSERFMGMSKSIVAIRV